MSRIAYVNGRYVPHAEASVSIEDRGFQFSDSVYEMVSLMDGHLADVEGHLDRLERSLSELRIAMPVSRRILKMIMVQLVRRNRFRNAGVYIQISRGVARRDFKFPKGIKPTLVLTVTPMDFDLASKGGKKVITVPDIRWQRRDIKTNSLLAQVLAKQSAVDAGKFDAWMVDEKGFITEASASNAWIVDKKGNLISRPTSKNNILKGVTRSSMQALFKSANINFIERAFTVQEARNAAEAFATGATTIVTPVIEIDGKKIGTGKVGPVTTKIYDIYINYARDRARPQQKWNAK